MKQLSVTVLLLIVVFTTIIISYSFASVRQAKGGDPLSVNSGIDTLNMNVLVPAYFDPSDSDYWDRMAVQSAKMPGRLYAIANASDGPGSSRQSSYTAAINKMHTNGGKVLGYVYTHYGARALTTVKADIDAWYSFYPTLNGIFFDEQSNTSGSESYYSQLYDYVKQKDTSSLVITNPGTSTIENYLFYNGKRIADVICTFESNIGFDSWVPSVWCKKYNRNNFYVIPYNTTASQYVGRADHAGASNVGWIYCTINASNPYGFLPDYFENFCDYIYTGINSVVTHQGKITIDGTFNDWLNIPKLNTPPNPAATSGDTQDPNADMTNFWAANDTSNLYISYQLRGIFATGYFYHVYIDADKNVNTGYIFNDSAAVGADYMVENNNLYKYTGTGHTNWSWSQVSGFLKADSGGRCEMNIPLKNLFQAGSDSTVHLLFEVNNTSGTQDVEPDNYKTQYYSYTVQKTVTGIKSALTPRPANYLLNQNYPNPFNPTTIIKYQLPSTEFVSLKVYNAIGQEVISLVNQVQSVGSYSYVFGAYVGNSELPSGIYYYQLRAGSFTETKKMILVK